MFFTISIIQAMNKLRSWLVLGLAILDLRIYQLLHEMFMTANYAHGIAQSLQVRQLALSAADFAGDNTDSRHSLGSYTPFGERGISLTIFAMSFG
jgi:hypothetical protein